MSLTPEELAAEKRRLHEQTVAGGHNPEDRALRVAARLELAELIAANPQAPEAAELLKQSAWSVDYRVRQGELADSLEALQWAERQVAETRAAIVADLRLAGSSWADVAKLLGVSRQAAQKRFSPNR